MSDIVECGGEKPNYSVIPNSIIAAGVLDSMEARLTWMYLYSKRYMPVKWQIHPYEIQKSLGFGERGWRKAYKELTEKEFLIMKRTQKGSVFTFNPAWETLVLLKKPSKSKLFIVDNSVEKV